MRTVNFKNTLHMSQDLGHFLLLKKNVFEQHLTIPLIINFELTSFIQSYWKMS